MSSSVPTGCLGLHQLLFFNNTQFWTQVLGFGFWGRDFFNIQTGFLFLIRHQERKAKVVPRALKESWWRRSPYLPALINHFLVSLPSHVFSDTTQRPWSQVQWIIYAIDIGSYSKQGPLYSPQCCATEPLSPLFLLKDGGKWAFPVTCTSSLLHNPMNFPE